jgi:uncharacterized secreted protein with C-terminal beta-propeller domain
MNSSNNWTEIENDTVVDNFDFIKFDGENVILQSQSKSFYIKLTDTRALQSHTNNIEEADGKYSTTNGMWNIKPSSIDKGLLIESNNITKR